MRIDEDCKSRIIRMFEGISNKLQKGLPLNYLESELLVELLCYSINNDRKIGPAFIETVKNIEEKHLLFHNDRLFLVPYLDSMVSHARSSTVTA